jgi:ankyrin repeat protein
MIPTRIDFSLLLLGACCLLVSCASPQKPKEVETPPWQNDLIEAIRMDDVFGLSQVLSNHVLQADISLNANGVTPLMVASSLGCQNVVEWLLVHDAKANAPTTLRVAAEYPEAGGCTPLFMASSAGHVEIAKLLIEHGANVNQRDSHSNTPLIMASARGRLAIAKLLVQQGADVNYKDKSGGTPLSRAVQMEHPDVAEFLMDHGARKN